MRYLIFAGIIALSAICSTIIVGTGLILLSPCATDAVRC